jgi:undecaprenyl-diphosphatase
MNDIDRHVSLWINGWPDSWSPFLTFFSIAREYWIVNVFFGVTIIGMLIRSPRSRAAILLALLALAMANGMTDLFKHGLPTHRPFQPEALGGLIHLRVGGTGSAGTASAHAANMVAIATVLTLQLGRWGWPWIGIALLTAVSRIYVGAHFTSQVLLGLVCGVTAGFTCVYAYRAMAKRKENPKKELP